MSVELLPLCGASFVTSITLDVLSKKAVGEEGLMLANVLGKVTVYLGGKSSLMSNWQ